MATKTTIQLVTRDGPARRTIQTFLWNERDAAHAALAAADLGLASGAYTRVNADFTPGHMILFYEELLADATTPDP